MTLRFPRKNGDQDGTEILLYTNLNLIMLVYILLKYFNHVHDSIH